MLNARKRTALALALMIGASLAGACDSPTAPERLDFEALDAVIVEDDLMGNIDHDADRFRTRKGPEE